MKQSNNQVGEKVLVLGAGQLGRQCWRRWFRRSHSVMVPLALLCQGDPGINRANDVPAFINNWQMPVRGLSRSTSQAVRLQR